MAMKIFALALVPLVLTAPAPLSAAQAAGERVNQLVIYGDDPCPASSDGEIVVCARKDEAERYRIPENLRAGNTGVANEAWVERVKAYEYVGKTGTLSCSAVGAGGYTGCAQNLIDKAYAERAQGDGVSWGRLIEEERQKRLSRIDAEADAVEERARELEAGRAAREKAAEEATERLEAQDKSEEATAGDTIP